MVASRAAETPKQVRTRLGDQRLRQAAVKAAETPDQRRARNEGQGSRQLSSIQYWTDERPLLTLWCS
jgi:hypothetical protein